MSEVIINFWLEVYNIYTVYRSLKVFENEWFL